MIRQNILKIRERIASVCSGTGRRRGEIDIVAVAKNRTFAQIKEVIDAGIYDIGENRVQEALLKYNALCAFAYAARIKWHMVGHLQTNKVKQAVRIFDLIQSVDSFSLAQEIDKQAQRMNKIQGILVEVKTSPEVTKFGLKPDEVTQVVREISRLKNISVKGLMTVAPMADDPEQARPYFKSLRESLADLNSILNTQYSILSMGMTDDFGVAIEEGSTMVRLGRAVFEGE